MSNTNIQDDAIRGKKSSFIAAAFIYFDFETSFSRKLSYNPLNNNTMNSVNNLFSAILKAVAAPANSGGLFKKIKRQLFDPKITLAYNFI